MSRRWKAALLAVVLFALTSVVSPQRAVAADGSAVTVAGTGADKDLKITVNQTDDLINQVLRVSWTGGKPTVDTNVYRNYLQIMQCWGDPETGPTREQCQYGALYTDQRGGQWTGTRQATYGGFFGQVGDGKGGKKNWVDENESIKAGALDPPGFVPFESVTGTTVAGTINELGQFYDPTTTNEIPYGRTLPDGSGEEFFEVQTGTEAPGLGCGQLLADKTPRSCFLVVVPRGEDEINAAAGLERPHQWLDSSPLEQSNWDHRIVVPLKFQPIGNVCPLGSAERRTVGAEAMTEAILRWQPALCAGGGTVYGYSQVTDDLARLRLSGTDPGMAFVDTPALPNPAAPQVYAPVAISGLAVSLNVEWQAGFTAGAADRAREGRRVSDLKLNPRLVAKLLTQSYAGGADPSREPVEDNPIGLGKDPEFLALNPDFQDEHQLPLGVSDVLVPLGQTDLATRLWQWVIADPDARAFLTGKPDPDGMKVNSVYQTQAWPQDNFPKSDLYCIPLRADDQKDHPWCTLDMHPYANNMHDAARFAARGDKLVRNATSRDPLGNVIGWKKGNPQIAGKRAVMAITDVATAERYGLPMAKLMNRGQNYIAPTTQGLLAGFNTFKPNKDIPNTYVPDPEDKTPAAYPLTTVVYAATVPSVIDAAAGEDYAALLRYAAGDGQTPGVEPGTLPFGYAPLPEALRALTVRAAGTIEDTAGKPLPTPAPSTSPPVGGGTATGIPATPKATRTAAAPDTGSRPSLPVPAATPVAHGSPVPVAQTNPTPGHPVGNLRFVLITALIVGVLAALAGPLLLLRARGRGR